MSNAIPVPIAVSSTVQTSPGAGTSVQNLGPSARTFVLLAGSASDQVELWGSLDNVTFAPVERELADGQSRPILFAGPRDNVTIDDDRSLFYATRRAAGSGLSSLLVTGEDVGFQLSAASGAFHARNVGPAADVANLAAFTVAGNDGVTDVAGDVVFLYAQTNPVENGPYVVGAVSAGVAPLTRPSWWPAGGVIQPDQDVSIAAGTIFGGFDWRAFALAPFIVDAADPSVFPVYVALGATLIAGTVTITSVPIRSAGRTGISIVSDVRNTTALTVQYNPSTITPGAFGTASLTIDAQVAAGTINVADISRLIVGISNA